MFCAWCVFVVDPMDVCAYVCCRSIPSLNPPWLSLVYVLSWDCRDSVAAKVRAPRQERIRAAHRQQQAVAAQAREARHGGGTSFPPVDMLVYDDSDDEGHDDDSDVDESRSSTSDDSETDARGSLRDFVNVIAIYHTLFFLSISPCPPSSLAWGYFNYVPIVIGMYFLKKDYTPMQPLRRPAYACNCTVR